MAIEASLGIVTFVFEEKLQWLYIEFNVSTTRTRQILESQDSPPISVPKRIEELRNLHTDQLQFHRSR